MIFYSIRDIETKKPIGISIFSNGNEDFCNSCGAIFELDDWADSFYLVKEFRIAKSALISDPKWYNASLQRPQWPKGFNPINYEVFAIDID